LCQLAKFPFVRKITSGGNLFNFVH
jgi:hypothetical protein